MKQNCDLKFKDLLFQLLNNNYIIFRYNCVNIYLLISSNITKPNYDELKLTINPKNIRSMKKFILIAALVLLQVSCSSTNSSMTASVGQTKAKLIKAWGNPVRTLPNNQQGEILVYADQVFTDSNNSKMAGENYWIYNYVYVNNQGKVTSTRKEKQNYPPQAIDSQKISGMNLLTSN